MNEIIEDCSGTPGVVGCSEVGIFRDTAGTDACLSTVQVLNAALEEVLDPYSSTANTSGYLGCAFGSHISVLSSCVADVVNDIIMKHQSGQFSDCQVTTATTSQTTSGQFEN